MISRQIQTPEGLKIAYDECGQDGDPTVILLHGGGQTRSSYSKVLGILGRNGYRAVAFDLRGHGESAWDTHGCYSLDANVRDLRAVISQIGGKPVLVGASLGGLTSLLAVGESKTAIARALVLVDVVPNLESRATAEIRSFMTANPNGFYSVEEAANAVINYLPHRPRPPSSQGLMKNLRKHEDDRFYWHWDPRIMEGDGHVSIGEMVPRLNAAASRLEIPTMLIRGSLSQVVSEHGAALFKSLVPHAEDIKIEGADHMIVGDANDRFSEPLLAFLKSVLAINK